MGDLPLSLRIFDPFVLHMFLDRYISDHIGNSAMRTMQTFLSAIRNMPTQYNKKYKHLDDNITSGIEVVDTCNQAFRDLNISQRVDPNNTWTEELAKTIFTDKLKKKSSEFIFPGGWWGTGGHLVGFHFKRLDRIHVCVTYTNSGAGYFRHNNEQKKDGKKICILRRFHLKVESVISLLARLILNTCSNIVSRDRNDEDFYENTIIPHCDKENEVFLDKTPSHSTSENDNEVFRSVECLDGRIYADPQISGSCTFHGILWILWSMLKNTTDAEQFERELRFSTLALLDVSLFTSEELTCMRRLVVDYGNQYADLLKPIVQILATNGVVDDSSISAVGTKLQHISVELEGALPGAWTTLEHYMHILSPDYREAGDSKETNIGKFKRLAQALLDLFVHVTLIMKTLIVSANKNQNRLARGTGRINVIATLLQSVALDALERFVATFEGHDFKAKHFKRLSGDDIENINIKSSLVVLAKAAGQVTCFLEINQSEPRPWFLSLRVRLRKALPRLLLIVIAMNNASDFGLTPCLPEQIGHLKLKEKTICCDHIESHEEAQRVLSFLPYCFVALHEPTKTLVTSIYNNHTLRKETTYDEPYIFSPSNLKSAKSECNDIAAPFINFLETNIMGQIFYAFFACLLYKYSGVKKNSFSFATRPCSFLVRYDTGAPYISQRMDDPIVQNHSLFYFIECTVPPAKYASDPNDVFSALTWSRTFQGREKWDAVLGDEQQVEAWLGSIYRGSPELDQKFVFDPSRRAANIKKRTLKKYVEFQVRLLPSKPVLDQLRTMDGVPLAAYLTAVNRVRHHMEPGDRKKIKEALEASDILKQMTPRKDTPTKSDVTFFIEADNELTLAVKATVNLFGGKYKIDQNTVAKYLIDHAKELYFYGDSNAIWTENNVQQPPSGQKTSLVSYLITKILIDWMTNSTEKFIGICRQLVPVDQKMYLDDATTSSTKIYSLHKTALVASYLFPTWFSVETDQQDQEGRVVRRDTQSTREWVLAAATDPDDDIGKAVANLNRGGFGCVVWASTNHQCIEFSDHVERKNALVRSRKDETSDWTWRLDLWDGRSWDEVVLPAQVPTVVQEWGCNYAHNSVFWVRRAGGQKRVFPDLVILTSDTNEIVSNTSVFNKNERESKSMILPSRAMIFSMQACGMLPEMQAGTDSVDDMLLLFVLCNDSVKDRCIARLYWLTLYVLNDRLHNKKKEQSTLSSELVQYASHVIENVAHPFRYNLSLFYGRGDMAEQIEKRKTGSVVLYEAPRKYHSVHYKHIPLIESWLDITKGPAGEIMVRENKEFDKKTREDMAIQLTDVMYRAWERVHRTTYLHSLCTFMRSRRLHLAIWLTKVWEAYHVALRHMEASPTALREAGLACSRVYVGGENLPPNFKDSKSMHMTPKQNSFVRCFGEEGRSTSHMLFEIARGMFINRTQENFLDQMWPDKNTDPFPKIHQAVMGMGKSSVVMPFIVFRALLECQKEERKIRYIMVVQPEHLVHEALRVLANVMAAVGGMVVSAKGTQTMPFVRLVSSLQGLPSDMDLNEMDSGINPKSPSVYVISDTALKTYFLSHVNLLSPTARTDMQTAGQQAKSRPAYIDYENTLVIYDEIDSMYTPLRSEFNIPSPDTLFHPLIPADKTSVEEICAWKAEYGKAVIECVDNILFSSSDDKGDCKTTATDVLPKRLIQKITENIKTIRDTKREHNRHYGQADDESKVLAVPYRGVRSPMDESTFSDLDVLAIFTYATKRERGLLERDFHLIRTYFREWADQLVLPPEVVKLAFQNMFYSFPLPPCISSSNLQMEDEPNLWEHLLYMNPSSLCDTYGRHERLLRFYLVHIAFPNHLKFNTQRLNLSFIDMMNISRYKTAFSGTVNMVVPYFGKRKPGSTFFDRKIRVSDETTESIKLAIQGTDGSPTVVYQDLVGASALKADRKKNTDQKICDVINESETDPNLLIQKISVFIDAAAVWKDMDQPAVFALLFPILSKNGFTHLVCFDPTDHRAFTFGIPRPNLVEPTSPQSRTAVDRKAYSGPEATFFYYFDEQHSRGTDLSLPVDARALITVDADQSTLTDTAQAAFRLRWINSGQTACFLVSGSTSNPDHKKIVDGKTLYDRLTEIEELERVGQNVKHWEQNLKAVVRSTASHSWKKRVVRSTFEEPTPYDISRTKSLYKLPVSYRNNQDVKQCLEHQIQFYRELKDSETTKRGQLSLRSLSTETQLARQNQQNAAVELSTHIATSCLSHCDNKTLSEETQFNIDEQYIADTAQQKFRQHARYLNVKFSPMFCDPASPKETRVYIRFHGAKQKNRSVVITTANEVFGLDLGDTKKYQNITVKDAFGNIIIQNFDRDVKENSDTNNPLDAVDMFARLMCGAQLLLTEQIHLLSDLTYKSLEEHLRQIIKCMVNDRYVRLSCNGPLRTWVSQKLTIDSVLEQVRKSLNTIDEFTMYLFQNTGQISNDFGKIVAHHDVKRLYDECKKYFQSADEDRDGDTIMGT